VVGGKGGWLAISAVRLSIGQCVCVCGGGCMATRALVVTRCSL